MDTGNFEEPMIYEHYVILCNSMGIYREWEIKLSYNVYLLYLDGNYKKGGLNLYYNNMYFNEGSFN